MAAKHDYSATLTLSTIQRRSCRLCRFSFVDWRVALIIATDSDKQTRDNSHPALCIEQVHSCLRNKTYQFVNVAGMTRDTTFTPDKLLLVTDYRCGSRHTVRRCEL